MKEIKIRELLSLVGNFQELCVFDRAESNTIFMGPAVKLHGAILDRPVLFMSCTGDLLKVEI